MYVRIKLIYILAVLNLIKITKTMKNFSKTIAAIGMSLLTIGAVAQVALKAEEGANNHYAKTFAYKAPYHFIYHDMQKAPTTLTYFNLNYDSADAITNLVTTHYRYQGELINADYVYPADTVGKNYDCVNSVTVAFDSLFDPYQSIDTSYAAIAAKGEYLVVDTIVIPIVQINYSGINDTITISLNKVDGPTTTGYPSTTVIKDTVIIGQQLAMSSDNLISYIKWGVGKTLANPKFSVSLTYNGNKTDSCWFIYGFAGFTGSCTNGNSLLAAQTAWSDVDTNTAAAGNGPLVENTFVAYNEYFGSYGLLPTSAGGFIYYDCNGNGSYDPGTDGVAYYENAYIWALVHTAINTGINSVTESGLSVAQNYPNPFNKETQISYSLTKTSDVTFSVYDITGRVLLNNVYTNSTPGQHVINLSANSFSPGIYFYTFNVNGSTVTKKMVITE